MPDIRAPISGTTAKICQKKVCKYISLLDAQNIINSILDIQSELAQMLLMLLILRKMRLKGRYQRRLYRIGVQGKNICNRNDNRFVKFYKMLDSNGIKIFT